MNLENLELGILFPAFLAGLLVLATHVPLGQQVLNRGIVFIDLAIAQVAGLGLDEILDRDAVVLLEWAERFPELLPDERTEIRLTPEGESGRRIEIRRLPGK